MAPKTPDGVEEAAFVRQYRFCRVRGALSTLIRHAKRATFPKGEGKVKITFKIDDQTHKNMKNPFFRAQRIGHGA